MHILAKSFTVKLYNVILSKQTSEGQAMYVIRMAIFWSQACTAIKTLQYEHASGSFLRSTPKVTTCTTISCVRAPRLSPCPFSFSSCSCDCVLGLPQPSTTRSSYLWPLCRLGSTPAVSRLLWSYTADTPPVSWHSHSTTCVHTVQGPCSAHYQHTHRKSTSPQFLAESLQAPENTQQIMLTKPGGRKLYQGDVTHVTVPP